ncbi:MAG: class II glutamine amidotransferase [Thermoprotei archaeon]|nr:MAG: class II glutamine amidotransferase [Thermoprotei archaeon]
MCRLFGLYANTPVDVYFSFFESPRGSFEELSHGNPSGWGVAWLDENGWRIYKEPVALYASARAREVIRRCVRSKVVISHVRLASAGGIRVENTHPWLYRGWVFAHNGTVYGRRELLKLLRGEHRGLEGDTDSEALFHLVVQEVNDLGDPVEGIASAVEKIVRSGIKFTSLNFIASNGEKLYALRYAATSPSYYTLHHIERPRESLELRKLSRETQQLIAAKLARGEKAVVIASEPMSDEPHWKPVPNKHLMIVNRDLSTELRPIEI